MREITLQVTLQQEKWLKHFAEFQKEGAHDNLGTFKPIHLVQTRDERFIFDDGECGDETAWFDCREGNDYRTPEDLLIAYGITDFIPYENALYDEVNEEIISNEDDYFRAYGINSIKKVSVEYNWRTVSYHFTLQSAKDYIQYQSHNLKRPRTYTVAPGYANKGDYEPFFDFLMAAGTSLLEQKPYFQDVDYVDSEWGIGKWQGGMVK